LIQAERCRQSFLLSRSRYAPPEQDAEIICPIASSLPCHTKFRKGLMTRRFQQVWSKNLKAAPHGEVLKLAVGVNGLLEKRRQPWPVSDVVAPDAKQLTVVAFLFVVPTIPAIDSIAEVEALISAA
jgi:hypothetical protein